MARIIRSIFGGGDNRGGMFSQDDVSRYVKAARAGAASSPQQQALGAGAGLLGGFVQSRLFPTNEQKATRTSKQTYEDMMEQGFDFVNQPYQSQGELIKRLAGVAQESKNPLLMQQAAKANTILQTQLQELAQRQQQAILTRQQISSAKSEAEMKAMQLADITRDRLQEDRGLLNRDDQVSYLGELRKEFIDQIEDVRKGKATLQRLVTMPRTGAGDFQLISGFIKLVDDSIITGEEFRLAAGVSGKTEEILNLFKNFKEGDVLSDTARAVIKETATYLYRQKESEFTEAYNQNRDGALGLMVDDTSSPDAVARANNLVNSYIGRLGDYKLEEDFFDDAAKIIIDQGGFGGDRMQEVYKSFGIGVPNDEPPPPPQTPDTPPPSVFNTDPTPEQDEEDEGKPQVDMGKNIYDDLFPNQ